MLPALWLFLLSLLDLLKGLRIQAEERLLLPFYLPIDTLAKESGVGPSSSSSPLTFRLKKLSVT